MAESSLAQLPDDIDALKELISARDFALTEQSQKLSERRKKSPPWKSMSAFKFKRFRKLPNKRSIHK